MRKAVHTWSTISRSPFDRVLKEMKTSSVLHYCSERSPWRQKTVFRSKQIIKAWKSCRVFFHPQWHNHQSFAALPNKETLQRGAKEGASNTSVSLQLIEFLLQEEHPLREREPLTTPLCWQEKQQLSRYTTSLSAPLSISILPPTSALRMRGRTLSHSLRGPNRALPHHRKALLFEFGMWIAECETLTWLF